MLEAFYSFASADLEIKPKEKLIGKAKTIRHGKIIAPLSPAERPSTSAFFFKKRAIKA